MTLNRNETFFILLLLLLSTSCSEEFKHTSTGIIEYKIIPGNSKGSTIQYGDAVRYRSVHYYDDSILVSPYDHIPQIAYVDSLKIIPEYVEILKNAREGDSIITRILVDSLSKYQPDIPSYAEKGKYSGFYLKILSIIKDHVTAEVLENDGVKQRVKVDSILEEKQKAIDDKILADLIASKKITAVKTSKGTYVEIESYGNGAEVNSGDRVTLNFTANTLNGKIFSTTYDSIGKVQKPFSFSVDDPLMIPGLNEGIKLFKEGGKGRLFIPSTLAFGKKGTGMVKPNECVIFKIEVLRTEHKPL